MFRNSRQLRRWAARVLLVWLFGVGLGVANACWAGIHFQPGAVHPASAAAQQVAGGEEATPECALHGASQADAQQDGGPGPGHDGQARSNCKTYCDGFSVSITPLKTSLDNMPAHAMPVATTSLAAPVAGASPVHLLMSRRDPGPATPITIAFLRLAL